MGRDFLTHQADRDVEDLGEFISADSPAAAGRLVADFFDAFTLLADMPEAGHLRPDLTAKPIRFWQIRKRYLVVYRTAPDGIVIARVLDGRRDLPNILRDA